MDPVNQISMYLPGRIRDALEKYPIRERSRFTELHLRCGQSPTICMDGREQILPNTEKVRMEELERFLGQASGGALYSVQSSISHGFLTLSGGHRVGICGTAVMNAGSVLTIKEPSSLCIRFAKEFRSIGNQLAALMKTSRRSTLILGPPGSGKTTLLRDVIRILSDEHETRICLLDERNEVAAVLNGIPQLPVGQHTDVLSGFPKRQGIELALRAMAPSWIALDEISSVQDLETMEKASYCGVHFLATAHADSMDDLHRRGLYRRLLEQGIFGLFWMLNHNQQGREVIP